VDVDKIMIRIKIKRAKQAGVTETLHPLIAQFLMNLLTIFVLFLNFNWPFKNGKIPHYARFFLRSIVSRGELNFNQ
jgi:hypothetical protein